MQAEEGGGIGHEPLKGNSTVVGGEGGTNMRPRGSKVGPGFHREPSSGGGGWPGHHGLSVGTSDRERRVGGMLLGAFGGADIGGGWIGLQRPEAVRLAGVQRPTAVIAP